MGVRKLWVALLLVLALGATKAEACTTSSQGATVNTVGPAICDAHG